MSRHHRTRKHGLTYACRCESLEPRRLLVIIPGTAGSDSIQISADGNITHVLINGQNTQLPAHETDVTVDALGGSDIITILNKRSVVILTVNGGSGDDTFTVGGGNIDAKGFTPSTTFLVGGPDVDGVNFNDQNSSTPANAYQVTDVSVLKSNTTQAINYSGVERITLNTSGMVDTVNVPGTAAGLALTINTNGGNDTINIGSGNIDANLGGPVTVNGGLGTNHATINNTSDASAESQVLNGATFIDGHSHTFSSLVRLTINEGPGGTNLTVNAATLQTDINGGSGNDNFTVGGGDVDANLLPGAAFALEIDGHGGTDSIRINDLNDTNFDNYTFQRTAIFDEFVKRDGGNDYFVDWFGIESVVLDASSPAPPGSSGIVVHDLATPLRINANGGNDTVQVEDTSAPVIVDTGPGDVDKLFVNTDDAIAATVVIDQTDDLDTLIINAGGTVRLTSGAVLVKTRLAPISLMDIGGVLDLADGALLSRVGGPTLPTFQTWLTNGYNNGAWNGTSASGAINSSTAAASPFSDGVGYGLGSEITPTTIGPFLINPGDTLLRYTLDGDADLSGNVNLNDFNRVAANFGQSNKVWVDGDSSYDGLVNLTDFNALAANFGQSAGPGLDATLVSPAQERELILADLQ